MNNQVEGILAKQWLGRETIPGLLVSGETSGNWSLQSVAVSGFAVINSAKHGVLLAEPESSAMTSQNPIPAPTAGTSKSRTIATTRILLDDLSPIYVGKIIGDRIVSIAGDDSTAVSEATVSAAGQSVLRLPRTNTDTWFRFWADQWRTQTGHLSSLSTRRRHPAYQQIVKLGWTAVPLLLGELQARPDFWFSALREITNVDPVSDNIRGDFDAMRKAWLDWAKSNNVTPRDVRHPVPE